MHFLSKTWRQKNSTAKECFKGYRVSDTSADMSFMEMFDVLNQTPVSRVEIPVAFDNDCRKGICGSYAMYTTGNSAYVKAMISPCSHLANVKEQRKKRKTPPGGRKAFKRDKSVHHE